MIDMEVVSAVKRLIEQAAKKQGWSLAELTRRVDKGASTLHRWRKGTTVCYDLPVLIQICRYAGASMDEVFGLTDCRSAGAGEWADTGGQAHSDIRAIQDQLKKLQGQVEVTSGVLEQMAATIEYAQSIPETSQRTKSIRSALDKLQELADQREQERREAAVWEKKEA